VTITSVLELVRGVIRDPTANLTVTVLLVAALILLLLVLDVIVLLLISPKKKRVKKTIRRWVPDGMPAPGETSVSGESVAGVEVRSEAQSSSDTQETASTGSRTVIEGWEEPEAGLAAEAAAAPTRPGILKRIYRAVAAYSLFVLVAFGIVAAYVVSGSDAVCAGACHGENPAVLATHENDHLHRASCIACHERGRGAGVVGSVVSRGEMLLAWTGLLESVSDRPVSSVACMRCHDVTDGPMTSSRANVRISHEEPLEAGMNCVDCHGSVGHLGEVARVPVSMDRCLSCHDGDTAAAECSECHTTDIALTGRDSVVGASERITGSGEYMYPPVVASGGDCGGCHELEAQCDPCHGLRLPHPDEFVSGYHAADAAFEKKDMCLERCHTNYDCQACHAPFSVGHADNWKIAHQSSPWDAGCGCHVDDSNVDTPICVFCHENAPYDTVGERFR